MAAGANGRRTTALIVAVALAVAALAVWAIPGQGGGAATPEPLPVDTSGPLGRLGQSGTQGGAGISWPDGLPEPTGSSGR
jgi:hypothetical protein